MNGTKRRHEVRHRLLTFEKEIKEMKAVCPKKRMNGASVFLCKFGFSLMLLIMIICGTPLSASAVLIDFEDLNNGDVSYYEDGYVITHDDSFLISSYGDQGSIAAVMSYYKGDAYLVSEDGAAFNVYSVVLGGYNQNYGTPYVTFTGVLAQGGTVTQSFLAPRAYDMTMFIFDSSFQNLVSLTWANDPDDSYKIDSLNINSVQDSDSVPEPTTILLWGIGLAGLAGFRRKMKRGRQ